MARSTILVIDDEPNILTTRAARRSSSRATPSRSPAAGPLGLAKLAEHDIDLVLLDVMMPGETGLEVLPKLRAAKPETMVVMMSGNATIETAVQATKARRPRLHREAALGRQAADHGPERARVRAAARRERSGCAAGAQADFAMIGKGAAMRAIFDKVAKTAPIDGPRADHRRERHRQGAGRARDPRALQARRRAVRQAQLRGDPVGADRERAVRPREGRVHRRDPAAARQVRARRRRHAVPRRDRRHEPERAGQGPARAAGERARARRRRRDDQGRRARRRRDEQGSAGRDRRGPVPRGPLLPARGRADRAAAAARAPRGHPGARRALPRAGVRRQRPPREEGRVAAR